MNKIKGVLVTEGEKPHTAEERENIAISLCAFGRLLNLINQNGGIKNFSESDLEQLADYQILKSFNPKNK